MGTYLDATKGEDLESVHYLTAGIPRGVMNISNVALLCAPVDGVSAKFILNYIEDHASKPPSEVVWKEQSNTSTGCVNGQIQRSFQDTESLSSVFGGSAGPRREHITINSRLRDSRTHGGNSSTAASTPRLAKCVRGNAHISRVGQ